MIFSSILYTLAKQARTLGANKLAKQLFDKIQTLQIPQKFQESVEICTISARARPYNDPEELLPMCYRCSTYNPLTSNSNKCTNCRQKFVYSFVSFGKVFYMVYHLFVFLLKNIVEVLPLVEFQLENDISDTEAVRLIETPPNFKSQEGDNWKQEISEKHETLKLDVNIEFEDPFTSQFINFGVSDQVFIFITDCKFVILC